MKQKIRQINDSLIRAMSKGYNVYILGFWSLCESIFFPIPPDIGLITLSGINQKKSFYYATITTFTSVVGGIIGYMIGLFLYEHVGKLIISFYGLDNSVDWFFEQFNSNGAFIVFLGGFSPIPYKAVTLASGVAAMDITSFIVYSFISRGLRFFTIATLMYFFGHYAKKWLQNYLAILTLTLAIIAVIGVVILKVMLH